MPAMVTHYQFALRVFSRLKKAGIEVADRDTALIGAQGPDIFYFHRIFPWEFGESYATVGQRLHKISPARLFEGFRAVLSAGLGQYDAMLSYVEGFFCHYALDRAAHPYILWAQKRLQKEDPSYCRIPGAYHYRIESALDTIILRRETGRLISGFKLAEVLPKDRDGSYQTIGELYQPLLRRLFGMNAPAKHLALAPGDMRQALFLITDRSTMRQKLLLRPLEIVSLQGHIATSLFRSNQTDDWDYANEAHVPWYNPFDREYTSTDSFFDIYSLAVAEASDMILEFLDALPSGKSMQEITQDRGFASDLPGVYEEKTPR